MVSAKEFDKKTTAAILYSDFKTRSIEAKNKAGQKALQVYQDFEVRVDETRTNSIAILRNPDFQTYTIATSGGAITLGAVGGAFGLASGVVVGAATGIVPALFTFGLSIPIGGAMGGLTGLCTGSLVGVAAGSAGGFTSYRYRVEIKAGLMIVKVKAEDMVKRTTETATLRLTTTKTKVDERVCSLQTTVTDFITKTKTKSVEMLDLAKSKASQGYDLATTTRVGVTSTSAVAGAVVGGAAIGTFGTVAGAVVGMVPAIFTFGLSIPVGAVVGGCMGTAVGGSVGAFGAGAIGYGGFTHREAMALGWSTASKKADELKMIAIARASDAKVCMESIVTGSTGGTDKSA